MTSEPPNPLLPFQTWNHDKREAVFELLSKSLLTCPALARLLAPHEFAQIRALDIWTRRHYFLEAKLCARTTLTTILSHGARALINASMERRARYVLVCKSNLEEFLLELVRALEIFVGEEVKACTLKLKLPLALEKETRLFRVACWAVRALVYTGRGVTESLARYEDDATWFDQHLQEEVEMRRGIDMRDLVKGGVKGKWRRGWHILGFFMGRK